MTESSRASSTSIPIFLKTDIFFSVLKKKQTNKQPIRVHTKPLDKEI